MHFPTTYLCLVLFALAACVSSAAIPRVYSPLPVAERDSTRQIALNGDWDVAKAPTLVSDAPDLTGLEWTRVRMPNTVQNALFEAGKIPNPWYADNKKLQWISQTDWYLRKSFRVPDTWAKRHIRLRFDGMVYIGTVWLDGKPLGTHEGMLGGPTFDIAAEPGSEHELLVRIQFGGQPASAVIKPTMLCGVSMWGNKYWATGLYEPVRLVATGPAYLEAPMVRTESIGGGSAELWAQAMITSASDIPCVLHARILDPQGHVIWHDETVQTAPKGGSFWEESVRLDNPKLWWPNGMGAQPLYRLELSLTGGGAEMDAVSTRFGIRTIEVKRNPTDPSSPRRTTALTSTADEAAVANWNWESEDEAYRWLFVVNGRPVFLKGAAWLTSDDLLTLRPERESWMVRAAKRAGINLFRLNGGTTIFETDQLYSLCDENGILVWQELPLNWDGANTAQLAAWREQLTQSVLRIRQHPSLAIYVGGNEFSPVAPGVAPVLGLAREILAAYDNRPFRMSSPGEGRVGGPGGGTYHAYIIPEVWAGDPNWYPTIWGKGANFVSEWSLYANTNYSCLKRIIPKDELENGPVGWDFGAFSASHPLLTVERYSEPNLAGASMFQKASWFGDLGKASVEDLSEFSQMGQAMTYGYVFEQWRADFPYKGGHSVWTWNAPEPASTWAIVDWFGQPLIGYYAVKRANEPVHVMARHWSSWGPGETFHATVMAVNDGRAAIPQARVSAEVLDRNLRPVASRKWVMDLPGGTEEIGWEIPKDTPESFFFLVSTLSDSHGTRLSRQTYAMRVMKSLADPKARAQLRTKPSPDPVCTTGPWLKPQLEALPTALSATVVRAVARGPEATVTVRITNSGTRPAYPVSIRVSPDTYSSVWDDGYFWLGPGESRDVTGTVRLDMRAMDPLTNPPVAKLTGLTVEVRAWNAKPVRLALEPGNKAP